MPLHVLPDGAAMSYAEDGVGAPIVLVHGWAANAAFFRDLSTELAKSHRVYTLTLRGHPGSEAGSAQLTIETLANDIVSFADAFPLLVIGSASLDLLNSKLARPVSMANFRPNLVLRTDTPHIEDSWKRIRIGDTEFALTKPCTRCILTTIDPDTAVPATDGEPLATLKSYRREAIGITFGQNLLVRQTGTIRVGLPVEVVE